MTRIKNGKTKLKARKNVLKAVKGYRYGRSKKKRQAYEAISHAGNYAFAHRKDKKGDARRSFNVSISYALKPAGISYSKFMGSLRKKNIQLDRKILSTLAKDFPETFEKIVALTK